MQQKKKERKKKELVPEERWVVRVTDMTALLDYLVEQRCLSNEVTLKIGMDSGQGFLKVAIVLKEKIPDLIGKIRLNPLSERRLRVTQNQVV